MGNFAPVDSLSSRKLFDAGCQPVFKFRSKNAVNEAMSPFPTSARSQWPFKQLPAINLEGHQPYPSHTPTPPGLLVALQIHWESVALLSNVRKIIGWECEHVNCLALQLIIQTEAGSLISKAAMCPRILSGLSRHTLDSSIKVTSC